MKEEHDARKQLGYPSTLHESLIGIIGSTKYAGAVRYPETFGINSYLYCLGMRDKLRDAGVAIYEKTSTKLKAI